MVTQSSTLQGQLATAAAQMEVRTQSPPPMGVPTGVGTLLSRRPALPRRSRLSGSFVPLSVCGGEAPTSSAGGGSATKRPSAQHEEGVKLAATAGFGLCSQQASARRQACPAGSNQVETCDGFRVGIYMCTSQYLCIRDI